MAEVKTAHEIFTERRGRVAVITLNRPDSLNALSISMRAPLLEAFESASRDDAVGAIVVTGAGRAFSSGGDITFMESVMAQGGRFADFRGLVDAGRDLVLALDKIEKPVIAAVNGAAAGGGMSLALACDVRWASEKAKLGQSFVRIGLHPDWGALYTLPRLVGASRALELMGTGDLIDAAEALRLGIVSRVLAPEALLDETLAFAERLASGPRVAIAEIKKSVKRALGYTLEQALKREIEAQERCWNTNDAREGFAAFLAKREPRFTGR
ncbi:MAG: 2-(1,2-epoxy-1,2-dihydrophenyl)acetyl-CoA isomerase [Candidatus Eisenbacteria bacterium]|uniref:2-(1,2-epoxy-1,2-dihydrophenyl)acetyl-CoA isomerase n=1 Tax=Eiseniibacteriota bacterium TaxID=2212470 RepID=A0A538T775_UNCEI|nr:MAG: 2-(1,2-epoxy-1,2-dihydrophenyl)acetyl-CoA isomerase [Candidatus Eisenbacteria bacterium]